MADIRGSITVYFEDPFWVAVYERAEKGTLEAVRIVFGAEPKDSTVYAFFLRNWSRLQFSPPVKTDDTAVLRVNPKRRQRLISRQLSSSTGTSTKAQQAISLQREQRKEERVTQRHRRTQEEKQQQYLIRQAKKQKKHRGR